MVDVFGQSLFVTSLNRTSIVRMEKLVTSQPHNDSMIFPMFSANSFHIGDVRVLHNRKQYTPPGQPSHNSTTCSTCH